VIGCVFESKAFSRVDIDINETDPLYSLAGQLIGLPLKSLRADDRHHCAANSVSIQ
jgi:hypothetical protein